MSVTPAERARLTHGAAFASIAVAVLLVGLKSWAAWRTGSSAMLGSLADSALDLAASMATLVGVAIAAIPADEDHRFGHGKAESLAALVQVILIAVSATGIAINAVASLVAGERTAAAGEGIAISLIAIMATFVLLLWQRRVIARTGSVAIQTDHVHYQSDLLLNLAVIAALALDQFGGLPVADPLFAIAIAAWLLWGAWRAGARVVDQLLDREWPEERRQALIAAAAQHADLPNLHDLRTRSSGTRDFVQFHATLPGTMTVEEAMAIVHRVEDDLCRRFAGMELLIHIDPEGHVDEPGNALVEANEIAKWDGMRS